MTRHRTTEERAPAGRRGTVLLLALLILSSIVMASMGLSSLILSSLQQTRIIDASAVAYYAAESAVEDGLYTLRREDTKPPSVSETPVKLANGASWTRDVAFTESQIKTHLAKDATLEIDLYDPDAETLGYAAGIQQVRVDWGTSACAPGSCPKLSYNLIAWDTGLTQWQTTTVASDRLVSGDPVIINLPMSTSSRLYRLRIRAEDQPIDDILVTAYDGSGTPAAIPGRVRIDAVGSYGGTQQRLTVRMPRRTPLSGLYDFAVFSECSLVKGYAIRCP